MYVYLFEDLFSNIWDIVLFLNFEGLKLMHAALSFLNIVKPADLDY